eukprot:2279137-Pleurochrysis_carterae.AAC.2
MAVRNSSRAAKASAYAAREGVVPAGLIPASDRLERNRPSRRRPPTAHIQKYFWGCDRVVGIGKPSTSEPTSISTALLSLASRHQTPRSAEGWCASAHADASVSTASARRPA